MGDMSTIFGEDFRQRREGNPLKATKHVCKDCGHKIDESELLTDNWTGEKVCKTCGAKKAFSGLRGLSTL
tara:strand:+ start:1229 stop:1438 length:210 start_codon:yes stop_codon:yes gene_type:complete